MSEKKQLIYFFSLGQGSKLKKYINHLIGLLQLILYILFNVGEKDIVIVYHSLSYLNTFKLLTKFKRFKYILEVEELYSYIDASNKKLSKNEMEIIDSAQGYIFSNYILNQKINIKEKPFIIINGIYKINDFKYVREKYERKKLVYAGTLEVQKGVDNVLELAKYLNENNEIHIIGFGSEMDISRINKKIKMNNCQNNCKIYFDGLLKGEKYNSYLQKMDIGICIQNPYDEFNKFEFPSKIFSYLSNGLHVVSNNLIQVRESEISKYINIIDSYNISEIAEYIERIELNNCYTSKEILKELDINFKKNLKKLFKEMEK